MAETTIDKLQIIIESESKNAAEGVDRLLNSLTQIKNLNSGEFSGLQRISDAFKNLKNALNASQRISQNIGGVKAAFDQFKGIKTSGLKSITNAFKDLEGLSDMTKFAGGIGTLSSSLTKLEKIDIDGVSKQVEDLVAALKPLTDEMIRGGEKIGTYGEQMLAFVKAAKQAASAQVSISKSQKMSKTGTGGFLGGIFTTLKNFRSSAIFAFVTKGVSQIAKSIANATKSTIDYIEVMDLFNISMKNFSDDAKAFVSEMESKLGVNATEASKVVGTFMSLANSFGIASEQAYLMSKNLTQLAYDYSSAYNISVESAFEKLRSGFVGEIEPMRALGKDLSAARLQQELYNMGLNVQFESLTQADKATLRYIVTMKQSADQMNNLATTIDQPANMLRILKAQFEQLSRTIGSLFIPILSAILPYAIAVVKVLNYVAQAIANFFGITIPETDRSGETFESTTNGLNGIGDAAAAANKEVLTLIGGFDELNKINVPETDMSGIGGGNLFDGIQLPEYDIFEGLVESKVDEIVERIKNAFKELAQILKDMGIEEVINDFKRFGEEIYKQFQQYDFSTAIKESLLAGLDLAISAVNLANKFVLPLIVALDIPGIVYEAINTFTAFLEMLDDAVESVTPGLEKFVEIGLVPIAEWIGGKVKDAFQTLSEELDKWGQWFEDHTEDFTILGEKLGVVVEQVWDFLEPIADKAWEEFKGLVSEINDIFKEWGDAILECSSNYADFLLELGETLDEIGLASAVIEFFKTQIEGVSEVIVGLGELLEGLGLIAIGSFFNNWQTTWEGVKKVAESVWSFLKGLLLLTLGDMSKKFIEFLENVKNKWDETWTIIKESLSRQLDEVKKNWEESWAKIREKGNEIWNKIKQDWTTFVTNMKTNIVSFISSFKSTWNSGWDEIKAKASSIFSSIRSAANDAFSSITSKVSSMISKIKDAIDKLKDLISWKDKSDNLDFSSGGSSSSGKKGIAAMKAAAGVAFASGGVVSEPTYALVGEYTDAKNNPEIIAPQSVIEQSVINANGDMVAALYDMATMIVSAVENNAVTVEGDADAMFKVVRKRGVEYQRNTGKPVFSP